MDRYKFALGRISPSDIKLSDSDLKSTVKPSKIVTYDNLYAKPTQLGIGGNQRHSVSVLFSVDNVIYSGQYDFEECYWRTIPANEDQKIFMDRYVQYWFHHPETIDLFKRYRDQVLARFCSDDLSRIDEYRK